MASYLVISAIGEDKPGIVQKLSQMIVDKSGNITSSRMMAMGGEFTLMLMIEGDEKTIEDIVAGLPAMETSLGLTITSRITQKNAASSRLAYRAEVVSMDHPGIIQQVSDFFSRRAANIEEMNTDTYAAAHTGTTMFSLEMIIALPAETKLASLREEFLDFCDELNLDASLNPM